MFVRNLHGIPQRINGPLISTKKSIELLRFAVDGVPPFLQQNLASSRVVRNEHLVCGYRKVKLGMRRHADTSCSGETISNANRLMPDQVRKEHGHGGSQHFRVGGLDQRSVEAAETTSLNGSGSLRR